MGAVGREPTEGFNPGLKILRRDVGDRHHVLVYSSLIRHHGVDGEEVGDAQHCFMQTADIGTEDGHAARERFQHHAAARFGPNAGDERRAGLGEEIVDVVRPREDGDVGSLFEFG